MTECLTGETSAIDDGTTKDTFLIVPGTVVTLLAKVLTVELPPDGVSAVETLAGAMVPVGKPLPVMVVLVMPARPDEGVIEEREPVSGQSHCRTRRLH